MSRKIPEPKIKRSRPQKGQALGQNPPSGNIIITFIHQLLKFYFVANLPYFKPQKTNHIDWQVSRNPPREVVKASKPSKTIHHF